MAGKSREIIRDVKRFSRAGCRWRPLGQAYLFWPAGPGCGVYEGWCLWACWWCTCLPFQLSRVAASLLAYQFLHQLADSQLTNKPVRPRGLDRGSKKKKGKTHTLFQRERKMGSVGCKWKASEIFTCFATAFSLRVGHSDGQAVVRSAGRSGRRRIVAQSIGNHTSGGWDMEIICSKVFPAVPFLWPDQRLREKAESPKLRRRVNLLERWCVTTEPTAKYLKYKHIFSQSKLYLQKCTHSRVLAVLRSSALTLVCPEEMASVASLHMSYKNIVNN